MDEVDNAQSRNNTNYRILKQLNANKCLTY